MFSEWKVKFNKVLVQLKILLIYDNDIDDLLDSYDHDWFNNKCLKCIECNAPCITSY
jgi:hypothetical protein